MQAVWNNEVCTAAPPDAGASDGGVDAGPPQPPGSGCHCAAGEAASYGALAVGALAVALLAAVRRRRR